MSSPEHIPLRTFDGFLKQQAHDRLSAPERRLFDTLFPAFQASPAAAQDGPHRPKGGLSVGQLADVLGPFGRALPGEPLPRRFAGYNFPRRRYFTLCHSAAGDDLQTLAHELRAYRDPVEAGMVEVIDLAHGCTLSVNGVEIPLEPQPAFAVLIHEPEKLPPELRALDFARLPGLTRPEMLLHRFPYAVSRRRIERTIDLRFPDAREWFYRTFRAPSESSDSFLTPPNPFDSRTIARSRFHFENGDPPTPGSFWGMLPTLLNPDLGGGSPADTGSALWMVGHWMRQHDVNALVFPSSRCDAAAVFEGGELKHWQGWNLVEFAGAPMFAGARLMTAVTSPWAWADLPAGVRLHVAPEGSTLAGSFAVQGMVNYWASDYLGQLRALEVARSAHGPEPPREERRNVSPALASRAFWVGVLCLRWLRQVLEMAPAEEVEGGVLELQGLALPYGLYPLTGRVSELWAEARRGGAFSPADMAAKATAACDLVCRSLGRSYPGQDLELLTRLGADLEFMLCLIAGRSESYRGNPRLQDGAAAAEYEKSLGARWLSAELRERAGAFFRRALSELGRGGSGARHLFAEGVALRDAILRHLRAGPAA